MKITLNIKYCLDKIILSNGIYSRTEDYLMFKDKNHEHGKDFIHYIDPYINNIICTKFDIIRSFSYNKCFIRTCHKLLYYICG